MQELLAEGCCFFHSGLGWRGFLCQIQELRCQSRAPEGDALAFVAFTCFLGHSEDTLTNTGEKLEKISENRLAWSEWAMFKMMFF